MVNVHFIPAICHKQAEHSLDVHFSPVCFSTGCYLSSAQGEVDPVEFIASNPTASGLAVSVLVFWVLALAFWVLYVRACVTGCVDLCTVCLSSKAE